MSADGDDPQDPQQNQRFLLRWHRHGPTITNQLADLLEEGLFADVTLSVDGRLLRAHRLVLAACSPYFLRIFQEADRTHVDNPFVILLNANVEDVRAILTFIYKGECCVYKERIPDLLTTARNLKIAGLSDMEVEDYVTSGSNDQPENRSAIMNTVQMKDPLEPLRNGNDNLNNNTVNKRDVPETCKCFVCGKYLSNQYNLRVHIETHEETYHACTSCPHVSRSRDALRKHMSYRHPDKYNARKLKKVPLN